jgi:hypothetical protein
MKALSLTQPWASLIANGSKRIETRSWRTTHRGIVAIHASKGFPKWAKDECGSYIFRRHLWPDRYMEIETKALIKELPLGAIIALARIVDCKGTTSTVDWRPISNTSEYAFGDYTAGRFMWLLADVIQLPKPIPCTGALSLWEVPPDIEAMIQPTSAVSSST